MVSPARVEDVVRPLVPGVLASLVRRYGTFDECEDAVQEALLAAAVQWPEQGVPDNPRAWLVTVAGRRLTDELRRRGARRRREDTVHATAAVANDPGGDPAATTRAGDDSLRLLFLCCHPSLTPASQVALTLRAVGGLTTAEIAAAFLVPEATMAQRISRAKQRIREAGADLAMPAGRRAAGAARLPCCTSCTSCSTRATPPRPGERLARDDLAGEAVRLVRELARAAARGARGGRAPRPDAAHPGPPAGAGRRSRRPRAARRAGPVAVGPAARRRGGRPRHGDAVAGPCRPYQLQAAIAAVHDEAPSADATDWLQILGLYDLLARVAPNPVVALNRAVAVAMVHGPQAGLAAIDAVAADERLVEHHRVAAARAHLLELAGDVDSARAEYRRAARLTTSRPEQRYLDARARRLG